MSDVDSRLSTSGMQGFMGEDLHFEERKKLQQEQLRQWTKEQMEEKKRLSMEDKKANELYNSKAVEMDQRAVELSIADAETRKAMNVAVKEYNMTMVRNILLYNIV